MMAMATIMMRAKIIAQTTFVAIVLCVLAWSSVMTAILRMAMAVLQRARLRLCRSAAMVLLKPANSVMMATQVIRMLVPTAVSTRFAVMDSFGAAWSSEMTATPPAGMVARQHARMKYSVLMTDLPPVFVSVPPPLHTEPVV